MQTTTPLYHPLFPLGKIIIWSGLLASGVLLFGALIVASWGLNPYDAIPPQRIPQTGLDYDLYKMLILSNMRIWIVVTIIGVGVGWFIWLYYQTRHNLSATNVLMRRFILANVACVLAMSLLNAVVPISHSISRHRPDMVMP